MIPLLVFLLFSCRPFPRVAGELKPGNEHADSDLWLKFLGRESGSAKGIEHNVIDLPLVERNYLGNFINLSLPIGPEPLVLRLRPKSLSFPRHFAFLIRRKNHTQLFQDDLSETHKCLYANHGKDFKAFLDLCDGLNGIIVTDSGAYFIKPLNSASNTAKTNRLSHLVLKINNSIKETKRRNDEEDDDDDDCDDGRKELAEISRRGRRRRRRKRSLGDERKEVKVETAVFVDRDLYRHMMGNFPTNTERNLYRFVLAMINAVQLLYHDTSLDFEVTFVLKRLEILHSDPPQLQRSHDIDRYLNSFCTWQEKENGSWEKSPLHWDHALMLTGLDLYAIGKSGKLSNQVLGLAPVAGMCKPSSSCTVNEGLHFESVYVVAHEIGHNLGMRHDGPSADNDCDPNSHIMSPTLGSGKNSWSACSNRYLAQFLRTTQAKCLFETTEIELDHSDGGTLPGERFDSDQQCMLKYGKQSERSQTQSIHEICRDLRCTKERYTWTSHPALEGTKCGFNKWCRFGRCIEKDEFKVMKRIVDGGWTEWSPYSDCASACLLTNENFQSGSTGIAIATRTCNNPRPENGGKHCSGYDKMYRTCDALQCSNVPPLTVKEFAEQICRRAREVDKDLIGLGFQRNSSDAEEACTVWCYLYNGGAKSRGWMFPDGTACHTRTLSLNPMFCVSGRCEEFHCTPTNDTVHSAGKEHCHHSQYTQIKVSESKWSPVGPCRYSCVTPASGLRVLKRGTDHNIQLCQSTNCNKKMTLFDYATNLCTKYKSRVKKLSGVGVQLSASLEDPDRPCHVACQDDKYSHRFYLVTGEEGWFPFGSDCARGIFGKKAYCISGKCLEFGKNNMPTEKSELTFLNARRRRSLDLRNKTVTATVDSVAVRRLIDTLNAEDKVLPESVMPTIDFENPIHVSLEWPSENSTFKISEVT